MAKKSNRLAELATIHIYKKALGMSDDDYRAMLVEITGKSSAGDLTAYQRYQVLDHLSRLQDGIKAKPYPGRPHNMDGNSSRDKQLKKIEAQLASAGLPWSYADVLAWKICGVEKIAWVPDGALYKIITALKKQGERKGWGQ